jgi:hypothetical protein
VINLLCDRSLLGGYVDQTHHIDKTIIKKAEKSLLGKETVSTFSQTFALLKFFTPKHLFLLFVFLLFAGMLLLNQSHHSSFEIAKNFIGKKIHGMNFQTSKTKQEAVLTILSGREKVQHFPKEPLETQDGQ